MKSMKLLLSILSPYSYEESAMLYISSGLSHPTHERDLFREQSIAELIKIIQLTEGRAMILFTSKDDMKYVQTEFNKYHLPWKILVQDNDSSQQEVIEEFKNDEQSILLSTGIFWEGIDIKGPALSNLIIYRLPFPTPDPVSEYKQEQAFSEKEFFLETQVPKMIVRLRQGIGRLIRCETDKGIVSILDPRLSSNRKNEYKDKVISSIRFGRITESFTDLKSFVEQFDLDVIEALQ
ncbi:ATP-dependent DNA helicase [Ureibacillus sp. MALMAid1270]|uniref:ATP-dependent DNA helicase n=1 Tax=Ureibacillus sp. MALMAid1270 TaxID=3411629 RepID=UPI003BA5123C